MTGVTSLNPDTRLVPAATALLAAVGTEACVLDTKSGTYFMINSVGILIWNRLQARESLGEVHSALVTQFAAASDTLWKDLERFVDALRAQGLVSVEA
jgi:hypothetical protein